MQPGLQLIACGQCYQPRNAQFFLDHHCIWGRELFREEDTLWWMR